MDRLTGQLVKIPSRGGAIYLSILKRSIDRGALSWFNQLEINTIQFNLIFIQHNLIVVFLKL